MKIQKLLLSLLASAALFVACGEEKEPEPTIPQLNVDQVELTFEQGGGTSTITVTSNRPWSITTDADWLAFSPTQGQASDSPVSVTVTALANSSNDRTSSFKVKTDFDYRTVNVSQKGAKGEDPNVTPSGNGTASSPYNVAAALEKAKSLQAYNSGDELTSSNSAEVYTAGKVVSVEIDPSFGNATYYISADGTSTVQLEVYRGKYLEGVSFTTKDQLKAGDDVVVFGTIVNFKGDTPEYTTGSKLVSVNGETKAPEIDYSKFPMTTVAAFIEKAATGEYYRLKGKVSRFNSEYCSFDLEDESGKIYVYSVTNKDEWKSKISNGGTVELAGLYTLYTNKNTGATQHEVVNAQILSFEAGSDTPSGDPKGTGTLEDPYNPAGAAAAVKDLTWTSNEEYESTGDVYVKGKISRIVDKGTYTESGTFGNASFFISEDGEQSGEFQVYRALYLGNKKFESGQTDIKVGDEVIIYGKLMNYRNNTPETVSGKCYLYSLNGVTGGDEPGPGPSGDPKGTGTLEDPYNPAGAAAAVKDLTWTANDNYETTDVVYVKGKICKIANKGTFTEGGSFGNASFFISEDGTGEGEFQVYRTLYLGNKKFEEGQTDIKVGDEVIICGKLMNYRGNTPETDANNSYLYSLNGVSGGDEPGPGEEATEATVAQALTAENDALLKVGPAVVVASADAGFLMEQDGAMIYVYRGKAEVGDNVTVQAKKAEYGGAPQLSDPTVTVNSKGAEVTYPEAKDITATFATYASDSREYVTYKGTLAISGNYYNVNVEGSDVVGSIIKPNNDIASFNGKEVIITGYYLYHTTTKSGDKYLYVISTDVKATDGTEPGGGDEPGGGEEPGDLTNQFTSNVKWTKGENASDAKATVNGQEITALKLGTSSKVGVATIVLPKGSTSITFYGVAWKDKKSTLSAKIGDTEVFSQALAANDGAAGNPPFTMTVSASDCYTKTFDALAADTTLTLTTTGSNSRVVLFGINVK